MSSLIAGWTAPIRNAAVRPAAASRVTCSRRIRSANSCRDPSTRVSPAVVSRLRRVVRSTRPTDEPFELPCLDLPDTPANAEHFGRPGSSRGEKSAFPQARLVAVAECGTHAVFDAAIGSCSTSERERAHDLFDTLEPGMLLLADRGLYGFDMWTRAAATGADLLWRVTSTLSPRHLETLDDGSWLAQIVPTSGKNRQQRTPLTVRVIDYTLDDGRGNPEQYRLLTTILDPADASAEELALTYAQRWEIENTFDELKTHQRGPRAVLRSKSPPLVEQEIWGHLCCHYAIRTLMRDAATAGSHDRRPDVLRRRPADHPTIPVPQLFFPLITTTPPPDCGIRASPNYCAVSTRYADTAPTPASSNAKFSNGQPNAPTTNTIHNLPNRRNATSLFTH